MKLKIKGLESPITFQDENVNIIEVLNPKAFESLVRKVYYALEENNDEENLLLFKSSIEILDLKKVSLITSLFDLNTLNKKINTKLQAHVKCELALEIDKNSAVINAIEEINTVISSIDLDVNFDYKEITIDDIIKLYSLDVLITDLNLSFAEKLKKIIYLISEYNMYDILILVNIKSYLEKSDLISLYKYSKYRNVKLVLLESSQCELIEYEYKIQVDNDLEEEIFIYSNPVNL